MRQGAVQIPLPLDSTSKDLERYKGLGFRGSQNLGYLLWAHNKDKSIVGVYIGSPYSGKLPYMGLGFAVRV